MVALTFDILKNGWEKLIDRREDEIRKVSPSISSLGELYIKRDNEDESNLQVTFHGFENATSQQEFIPQIKRIIVGWIKQFSEHVEILRGDPTTLSLNISKEMKFTEAAVSVFKRDSKSNKVKRSYRCVGGKKNGRRVSSPDDCIGVPDFEKKTKFSINKRAKSAQSSLNKKKTSLTNLVSKRVRKANARLKKARGF